VRIPKLVLNRRHNVASLTISFAHRIWSTRDVGDVILGYNATGRLARIVLLDPNRMLPSDATAAVAIEHVTALLLRRRAIKQAELAVLRSALDRAAAQERGIPTPRTGLA
jgi:hypothetical protein